MSTPSWRQFAAIPFDATVHAVSQALDLEVPPEGRPRSFRCPEGILINHTADGAWVVCDGTTSWSMDGPGAVLKAARLPAGTPSGDAIRAWLRWWGWVPKSERGQAEPQEQTRMVT